LTTAIVNLKEDEIIKNSELLDSLLKTWSL
jgi:hypothetical protein